MASTRIGRINKDKCPELLILQQTHHISEKDAKNKYKWDDLLSWYKDIESDKYSTKEDKIIQSILNSIVFQDRTVFAMQRDATRILLKEDKNWKTPIGFKNDKYGKIIALLIKNGIIEIIKSGNTKRLHIFKVVNSQLLKMLTPDMEKKQTEELCMFIYKRKTLDDLEVSESSENDFDFANVFNEEFLHENTEIEADFSAKSEEISSCNHEGDSKRDACGDEEGKKLVVSKLVVRREGKEKKIVPLKNNKITFKQLLASECPDNFPRFDEIEYLASLAVENALDLDQDFAECEISYGILNDLEKHLVGTCGKKPSKDQKTLIAKLVKRFELAANSCALSKLPIVQLKPPKDKDEEKQSYTLNVLLGSFGDEKICRLESKIKNAADSELPALKAELTHWKRIVGQ